MKLEEKLNITEETIHKMTNWSNDLKSICEENAKIRNVLENQNTEIQTNIKTIKIELNDHFAITKKSKNKMLQIYKNVKKHELELENKMHNLAFNLEFSVTKLLDFFFDEMV